MSPVTPIDRIGPTRRPIGTAVMYQRWRHLLFLHWEIPTQLLQNLLPPGLEVDTHDGRAYVGLVPFTMRAVRPKCLPSVPWLSYFHETNVRTYVTHRGRDPGVWFFSLDAANPVAVAIARTTFGLPYYHARMGLEVVDEGPGPRLTYVSRRLRPGPRPAACEIHARATGPVAPAVVGSLEHFLAERYFLYSSRAGRLWRGQVHHTPYPLRAAEVGTLDETLLLAAGIGRPDAPPLAHYASEVRVEVFGLTPA